MVLAGRVELGVARGFDTVLNQTNVSISQQSDVPISQRFFAGGGTTVRGFQLDRLGVPEILTADGLSLGGNGVVILNAELRTSLGKLAGRDFGIATFTDSGNVFTRASDIDLTRLRTTVGFGLRYNSPLGPVRLDFGFKTDRQVVGGQLENRWEYLLNIGEAF
jgi:Outer membrane protein/protective antigen OMA87